MENSIRSIWKNFMASLRFSFKGRADYFQEVFAVWLLIFFKFSSFPLLKRKQTPLSNSKVKTPLSISIIEKAHKIVVDFVQRWFDLYYADTTLKACHSKGFFLVMGWVKILTMIFFFIDFVSNWAVSFFIVICD